MFENLQIAVIEAKSRRFRNSSECLKTRCASNNRLIWTQKVPKEAQWLRLQVSIQAFSKIVPCTSTVVCQKFGQYIRMLWHGRFFLVESVTANLRHKNSYISWIKISQFSTNQNFSKNIDSKLSNEWSKISLLMIQLYSIAFKPWIPLAPWHWEKDFNFFPI